MTVAQELKQAERVLEDVEDLDKVKGAIEGSGHPDAVKRLNRVRERRLAERWVRVSVAARLLGLSTPTVYKWADLGLLVAVNGGVTKRVTLHSVLEIRPFVRELRRLGKTRHLLQAVIDRIDDTEMLASPTLRQSIEQMRRGELIDITPQE